MFSPRGAIKKFKKIKIKFGKIGKSKLKLIKRSISYDTDESIKSALFEICIYVVFMVATTILANAAHHLYMFYFNQALERSFIGRYIETELGTEFSFNDLVTTADWWIFMEKIFLSNIHGLQYEGQKQYNVTEASSVEDHSVKGIMTSTRNHNTEILESDSGSGDYNTTFESSRIEEFEEVSEGVDDLSRIYLRDNILLGAPRLRQIRVKENSCQVHEVFLTYFTKCYAEYSKEIENKTGIYKGFYTMSELQVNVVHGQITNYYGAGYTFDLTYNHLKNLKILQKLKMAKWIDRGTRLVILEFVLFNINANIFNNAKIIAEITPVGSVVPSHKFQALKFHTLWTEGDWLSYTASGIFYALVIYYTFVEIIQFSVVGAKRYFSSIWNILDISVLIVSYLSLVYNLIHPKYMRNIMARAKMNPNDFVSIDYICFWNVLYIDMMGVCVFLVWIKMFKYISFNKTMLQFSTTLKRCAKDLFGFAVMFFIVFLAYAQLGLLIFGSSHPDFREFGLSVITLMRMFLGDFDYQLIEKANQVLGPLYFLTYVLFVFFILLNMFLAIINDTYGSVKSEVLKGRSHFGSYLSLMFKKSYSWCIPKRKVNRKGEETLILEDLNGEVTIASSVHPSSSAQSPSTNRIRKRTSEILREYFEILPSGQQPQAFSTDSMIYQRLNDRVTLLEGVLEQLIDNMDHILKKFETKKVNNRKI